ncbi:MAG: hypothetical protein PUB44_06665 [Clostridium sp.]|nr:hypothetical protein [Clostridium sp.]MED9806025.1 hypothetical protein [Lachnospiraceae bacterium]MEE0397629.1 hypothetical protein [Lachnospiraceae bacterium]CDA68248.1 putative uncharacterized protein [Clostridium sp. CAG:510]
MNLEIWQEIGSIGILAISTFWDIRFKKIPLYLMAAGILPGLILLGLRLGQSTGSTFGGKLMETAGCFLPGLFLLLLSFLTERKVGMGDGLLLLIIGAMEGAGITGFVFCWGLFLQSLFAVVLVILRKADRKTELPFVPFLLMGRLILFVM